MDYSLAASDHVWVMSYAKSAISALLDTRVLALLGNYFPGNFSIERTLSGRPFAQSPMGFCPFFSVAHSSDVLVVALSSNIIGIDVEFMKTRAQAHKISARYFSCAEPKESLLDFYRSWTAREAYIKAQAQTLRELPNIVVACSHPRWAIGTAHKLDHRVIFKLWSKKYLIAVCRKAAHQKTLRYFTLTL